MVRKTAAPLPPHPGIVLRDEVVRAAALNVTEVAEGLGVSRHGLSGVLNGHAGISAELALRLERAGAGPAARWIRMQAEFDLAKAAHKRRTGTSAHTFTGIRPFLSPPAAFEEES